MISALIAFVQLNFHQAFSLYLLHYLVWSVELGHSFILKVHQIIKPYLATILYVVMSKCL